MVRRNTTGNLPRVELDSRVTEFLEGFMNHYGVSSYKEALVLLTRKYTELETANQKLQRIVDGVSINVTLNSSDVTSKNQTDTPKIQSKPKHEQSKADKAFMDLLK